jgi:hypothetical protein
VSDDTSEYPLRITPDVYFDPDPSKPFGMVRLLWHVWRKGHTVIVNRNITVPMGMKGKGWLYKCECGGVVAL